MPFGALAKPRRKKVSKKPHIPSIRNVFPDLCETFELIPAIKEQVRWCFNLPGVRLPPITSAMQRVQHLWLQNSTLVSIMNQFDNWYSTVAREDGHRATLFSSWLPTAFGRDKVSLDRSLLSDFNFIGILTIPLS